MGLHVQDDIFPQPAIDYLMEHPVVNRRPVRLLTDGGGVNTPETFETWAADQVPEGHTLEECQEQGITIVHQTLLTGDDMQYEEPALDVASNWTEDCPYTTTAPVYIYDVMAPRRDAANRNNYVVSQYPEIRLRLHDGHHAEWWGGDNDIVVGEYTERLIALRLHINTIEQPGYFKWENLFDEPLIRMASSSEELTEFERVRIERDRDRFIAAIAERDALILTDVRDQIRNYEDNLVYHEREKLSILTRLREQQAILDAARANLAQERDEEDFVREWDALHRHASVQRVTFTGDRVSVFTHGLELTNPDTGESTIVGEFKITFNLANNTVSAVNRTNRRGNRDHPHIVDGSFCLGELQNTVTNLVRDRQLGAAINVTIEALQHVNPRDDWGRHVYLWFNEEADRIMAGGDTPDTATTNPF